MNVSDSNSMAEAVAFVMFILAVPVFVAALVATLILLAPVLVPLYVWQRVSRRWRMSPSG